MAELLAIDPHDEEIVGRYPRHQDAEVEARLAAAASAQRAWRSRSFAERARPITAAAKILRERAADWAGLMASEMGKPLAQGRAEAEKCALVCDHYAANAEEMLRPEIIVSDASRSYVRCDPLGVILAIMPWNFPFWQLFRCAAPALMAGNAVLLKHAANVPGCALAIEAIFREAGLPEGLFATLLVEHDAIDRILADDRVHAVSLTGSERAGAHVARTAGENLKPQVLELGGSDAFIVLADADLEKAARTAADARCINTGQSCIAAKRFIVEASIAPEFTEAFRAALAAKKLGNPRDDGVELGPLARADLRESLHQQVERSISRGARLLLGGEVPAGRGFYYPATLLTEVAPDMAVWDEETFGPVAAVYPVKDAAEAIARANASRYGLGAALFTRDQARAEALAAQLECGAVFINGLVKSDPRLPFGGVKKSGYGRELSWHGIREHVNQKTVWIG